MKVLSILQPWASLCVTIDPKTGRAAKQIETRSWNTKYRGDLLIHASASKKEANEMIWKYPFNKVLVECFERVREPNIEDLPFGVIIGKVTLIGVIPTEFATSRAINIVV